MSTLFHVCKKPNAIFYMSRRMGKPTICIGENKDTDQLRGNREADQRLCFRYSDPIVQFLLYLTSKFQASSSFLCLHRPVCVRPVRKPHCWFSHEAAHMLNVYETHLCIHPVAKFYYGSTVRNGIFIYK